MIDKKDEILSIIDTEEYKVEVHSKEEGNGDWGIFVFVNGVKLEWNWSGRCIKTGYGNHNEDILTIKNFFIKNKVKVDDYERSKLCVISRMKCTPDEFKKVYELLVNHNMDLIKMTGVGKQEKPKGPNFEGTIFEPLKERGATIGGMMGKMVCEVAGINRDYLLPEFHTKNSGEIDGVEICPDTQKPITIYECQSGIHYGNYLDEHHLNKGLHKYLYAEEIVNTVKKVVFLAGGYSNSVKNIIKERRTELLNRDNPIEVVLLKTTKKENKIGIVEVVL